MTYRVLLFTLFIPWFSNAQLLDNPEPVKKLGSYEFLLETDLLQSISDYQIGDEWGKIQVTEEVMNRSAAIRRAAMATVKVGGGTGFILGEFQGDVVIATNHHVCESASSWSCSSFSVPLLDVRVRRKAFLGTWPNIDLTLMTVSVSGQDRQKMLDVAANFDFDAALTAGLPLITSGFGVAGNFNRSMMINFDSDCRVISQDGDFRLMADPDEKNPADYEAWSFANGCDVSHGDSGSAMVDATTGSPIGIIWTGRIPKTAAAQSSANILQWQEQKSEQVWRELSFAVPAAKIQEFLGDRLQDGSIPTEHRSIIQAIIQ